MPRKPVSIAVMGAGLIGKRHIDLIAAHREASLHCVIDPAEAGRELALKHGVPWHLDLASMLAQCKPDGLIIATPNQLHTSHGLVALQAGIPMLIEKPLADTVEGGQTLVAAADAAGIPLLTGHHRRHNPMIQRAKAFINEGRLGRIVAVHAFFWLMKPDDYFDVYWRRQPGAGPVLINFIHDIDLLRYLCGDVEAVQAFSARNIRQHDVDESAAIILRFASGALGSITVSDTIVAPWSWEQTSGENPAYPQTGQSCYHIGGTHGALSVPQLDLWRNPGARSWLEPFETERFHFDQADPLDLQIGQFCAVIRGEQSPLVSGRDGLANLRIVDAVQRAAREGILVEVTNKSD
ncbi:MviM Predicted dehydrogenases and related proteins [Rhabdaerophilaceae bacterium]